jgi:hypothetical protein
MKKIAFITAAIICLSILTSFDSPKAEKVVDPKPMQIISWLDGRWVKAYGDTFMEEHWSALGGTFVGMCREIKDGNSTFIEIMVIEPDGEDTVLRIRHFGPGLKSAWEEKETPMVFKLSERSNKKAVFEGTGVNQGENIIYSLLTKDILDITTEFVRDGKKVVETTRMIRK